MPLIDDCEADAVDVTSDTADIESATSELISEVFDHLGRSFNDESPRDPNDATV